MGVTQDVACSLAPRAGKTDTVSNASCKVSTDKREWLMEPTAWIRLCCWATFYSPKMQVGYYCRGAGSNWASASESLWELSRPASPKKDECEIVIVTYQELNTVSYAVYIPLFSPINKTLFMKSTESCVQMKRISLLSTRKLSFIFPKLLDGHLSLEVTPRIWTQPLLPVKSWQKGYTSKWILSFLSLPKASNSIFGYIQAVWYPVKTIR